MKSAFGFLAVFATLAAVQAHYTLPDLTVAGVKSGDWVYTRETANHYSLVLYNVHEGGRG
jgi:hypothetical protein